MAMFFDPYGSSGTSAFGGSTSPSLYGGLLDDTQQEALRQRGLMGFLGGMQKAGSLDYVDPFSGVRIGGLAAGLAGGAQGMLNAQDQGVINALNAQKLGLEGQQLQFKVGGVKALMPALQKLIDQMGGAPAGSPDTSGPQTAGPGGVEPSGGIGTGDDPRGLAPYIQATAFKYGVDPDTALAVARSEGLANPVGDGGKSGGAFQLFTGGGMGNDFQKDTGLDPLDPKNERATIDYALKRASQEGWGAWNGAKKIGVTGFMGIDRNAPSTQFAGTGSDQSASGLSAPSAGDMGLPGRSVDLTLRSAPTSSPGIAQGDNGQPFRPASAQQGPDLAEGDSIGVGFTKYGGLSGNPVGGRSPQAVLGNIAANVQSNPDYYRGKTVLLSSGTMNDPDGSMTAAIPQQIAAIKAAGGNVVLAGADTGKFAPRNAQLAQIAQATGVPFAGALPTDNVHPGPDGYKSYVGTNAALALRIAQNGAPAAPIQLAQNGPATALAPAMPQAQPPMARGLPQTASGIDPRALALAGTGAMAGLYGLGDVVKPLENAFYNSPQQKGAVAGAVAGAEVGPHSQEALYKSNLELRNAFLKPENVRSGGVVGTAQGGPLWAAPVLHDVVNPDGSHSVLPINPLTGQPVQSSPQAAAGPPASPSNTVASATGGITTKLDPATEHSLEAVGKDDAKLYNDYRSIYLSNQSAEVDLKNAMDALQYVRTGTGAEMTNDVAKALRAMHIDASAFVTLPQPAQLEIVQKAAGRLLGNAVKQVVGNNRPALGEFDYLKGTVINEGVEPEAQRAIAAALLSTMNWQDKMFGDMQTHRMTNHGSPAGYDVTAFGKQNPMPTYYSQALESFPALKGEEPLPQHPNVPANGGGPSALPQGAKHIGAYKGNPVYQLPDGSRKVLQ